MLATDIQVLFTPLRIEVYITVYWISGTDVYCSCSISPSNIMFRLFPAYFPYIRTRIQMKLPLVEVGSDTLVIYLSHINQLKDILTKLVINRLTFRHNNIHLNMTNK